MTTLGVVCLPQVPPAQLRDAAQVAADAPGLAEAGADAVILQPSAGQADLDQFERFIRFAAEQVRPLL